MPVVLRFPALGSFGLLGAAALRTPPAGVGDFSDFLHVDVHHLHETVGRLAKKGVALSIDGKIYAPAAPMGKMSSERSD